LELLIESLAAGESDLHPHEAEIDNADSLCARAGTEVFNDGRTKKDDGSMEVDEIGVVLGN